MKEKIGIIIDSSSTFTEEFITKNNIRVAPLSLVDSQSKVYTDNGRDISQKEFVSRLRNGENFKTSMTSIGQLMDICDEMFKIYQNIIFLPVSKGLSGQWQTAQIVKKEYNNFFVVNSISAAYTNELTLINMVEDVKNGKSVEQIINNAEKLQKKTFNIFSVEDASGMKAGGRITSAILKVINTLKFKPIIRFDNKNEYAGVTRNYTSGIKKMVKRASKWCDQIDEKVKKVCIYFSGYTKEKLNSIKNYLSYSLSVNEKNIEVRWVPNVILAHTKPGSYGFCILVE